MSPLRTSTRTSFESAVFRNVELQREFQRDGFVVVDFADRALIDELMAGYHRLDSGIDAGYYPSLMSTDLAYKADTHRFVADLVFPNMNQLISSYKPLLGVYMVKHPGPDTEVPPHQDWIVADESRRPTMNVWMPLTSIDDATGRMRVLPGSHRWLSGLRGSPSFPTQWEADYERVRDELMQPVDIGPGQAMVYDIRVLHGTPPNRSDQTRVVTSLYAIPDDTTPIHYHRTGDGDVTGYHVSDDFCATFNIGDTPNGEPFEHFEDYKVKRLDFEAMRAHFDADRARWF